jgi:hypothetical protein
MMAAALAVSGIAPMAAFAQAAAAPAVVRNDVKKDKSIKVDETAPVRAPDAALLDYLGRYGDAADGLDPLGLAEPDAGPADAVPPKDGQ